MHSSEHAVCVAINDNNRAWYEMLVPFLLSLRHTGYDGRIAVIGYGPPNASGRSWRASRST